MAAPRSTAPAALVRERPGRRVAQAAADRATRFVRVMLLPRELLGTSSIQYVNEEDKAKPRSQSYRFFADMPIALRGS